MADRRRQLFDKHGLFLRALFGVDELAVLEADAHQVAHPDRRSVRLLAAEVGDAPQSVLELKWRKCTSESIVA